MDLKNIMLGKISQPVRAKNHDFTHMWDIQLKPTNEQIRKTKKQTKTHR